MRRVARPTYWVTEQTHTVSRSSHLDRRGASLYLPGRPGATARRTHEAPVKLDGPNGDTVRSVATVS